MKLTPNMLKKIVIQEAAKFGKMKSVKDVKTKEVCADELANTLEDKKDFTVKEVHQTKLLKRLKEIKLQETRLAVQKRQIIATLTK